MAKTYQMCATCVMDTSDPEISFNAQGICNHCQQFDTLLNTQWFPNEEGQRRLTATLDKIRKDGAGQEYDCIIGLSGGVDSSYLALKAAEWNLRPLVVHVDAGWNAELAVANIESIVKHCGFDLVTHVVDWEEMRDLHLAYLRAGIPNQDVPQDHVFFASLYTYATKNNIRHVLSGGNLATEGIFPSAWHGSAMDSVNLKAIHRKFGKRPLKSYQTVSFLQYYLIFPFIKKMATFRPLNYMPFDKAEAVKELERAVGWKSYGRKHGESLFTKLFQNHYLPTKFGYDKRRPHLSSMIKSGQMTRDDAIAKLTEPLYEPRELEADIAYFCKKLRISRAEYDAFVSGPNHHHTEFPTWDRQYKAMRVVKGVGERLMGRRLTVYS